MPALTYKERAHQIRHRMNHYRQRIALARSEDERWSAIQLRKQANMELIEDKSGESEYPDVSVKTLLTLPLIEGDFPFPAGRLITPKTRKATLKPGLAVELVRMGRLYSGSIASRIRNELTIILGDDDGSQLTITTRIGDAHWLIFEVIEETASRPS